jgi:hypothetical protein
VNDDLAAEGFLRRAPRCGAHRRHAALHVGGTARVQPSVALFSIERRVSHPIDADDVEVTAEHQPPWRRRSDAREQIGSAW